MDGDNPVAPTEAEKMSLKQASDAPASLEQLRKRAEKGDADAWFDIGAAYITGDRVPQNFTEAANAFTKAAELGSIDATFNLGVCFQHGDGRPKDLAASLVWFGKAANAGHPEAIFQLALAYRAGILVPQDITASNALMLYAQAKGVRSARSRNNGRFKGRVIRAICEIARARAITERAKAARSSN